MGTNTITLPYLTWMISTGSSKFLPRLLEALLSGQGSYQIAGRVPFRLNPRHGTCRIFAASLAADRSSHEADPKVRLQTHQMTKGLRRRLTSHDQGHAPTIPGVGYLMSCVPCRGAGEWLVISMSIIIPTSHRASLGGVVVFEPGFAVCGCRR